MTLASQTSILHDLGLVAIWIGLISACVAAVAIVTIIVVVGIASRREDGKAKLSREAPDHLGLRRQGT